MLKKNSWRPDRAQEEEKDRAVKDKAARERTEKGKAERDRAVKDKVEQGKDRAKVVEVAGRAVGRAVAAREEAVLARAVSASARRAARQHLTRRAYHVSKTYVRNADRQ